MEASGHGAQGSHTSDPIVVVTVLIGRFLEGICFSNKFDLQWRHSFNDEVSAARGATQFVVAIDVELVNIDICFALATYLHAEFDPTPIGSRSRIITRTEKLLQ